MKRELIIISALVIGSCILLLMPEKQSDNDASEFDLGQTEVNPITKQSARKAYEFARAADPNTGEIPRGIRAAELQFASRLPKKEEAERGLGWSQRGPFNIGGRTRALAVDITDENILNAGGVSGGMWRSTDAGQTWVKTTDPSQIHSVSCVVQDRRPGHENVWYHGTGEEAYGLVSGTSYSSIFSGDGIFKSIDGGQSWTQLESTSSMTPQSVQDGTYDFSWRVIPDHTILDEDVVLAAVYGGVIRSTDGGETWEEVLGFSPTASLYTDIHQTPNGIFYAALSADGLSRGTYRSEDGINWTQLDFPLAGAYRRIVMTHNPQDENEVYFLLEGPSAENTINHALFKYTFLAEDGTGENGTWEERSGNLPQTSCALYIGSTFEFGIFSSQSSYDLCIGHHPTEEDVLYIGGRNVFRSTNAFTSEDQTDWIGGYRCNPDNPRDYSYPNHHSDQHVILFSENNPDVMYSANDGGVYRTDDCMADSVFWTSLNQGYVTSQFYAVAQEQGLSTSNFVMGGMQDNGTWGTGLIDFTESWKEIHNDDGAHCAAPEGLDFVITSSQLARMYKKQIDEFGNVINARRIDPQNTPSGVLFINALLVDPVNNNELYMAGGKNIRLLSDLAGVELNGDLMTKLPNSYWENMSEGFIGFASGDICALEKSRIDATVLYYGSTEGHMWKLENLYGDRVKTEITGPDFPDNSWLSSIAANDLNADELLACHSSYGVLSLWHSDDAGESWESIAGNLEENPDGTGAGPAVYAVEIYPSDPPIYFAGTSVGLFSTAELDGMNTVWSMEGAETIGNVVINMINGRAFDGSVVVATHGNGIYANYLAPIAAIGTEDLHSPDFAFNVYPNPFTESLNFKFDCKKEGKVSISLYNSSGKLIVSENLGNVSSGIREIRWMVPSNLPAGMYSFDFKVGGSNRRGNVFKAQR